MRAWPRPADAIAAIEITGNRTVEAEAVRSHLKLALGSPYDAAKADQSIKALFATGLFADVSIERRGSTIVVKVVENPIVTRVYLEGNAAIDKAKLEEQIELKPRAALHGRQGARRRLAPARALPAPGPARHHGRAKLAYQSDGRVEVAYVVKEGEVTKVDSIGFVGNRAFTASQLRDVISTSQSGWLDILKSAAFYDPERLNQDKELLRRHYLKQGFPDARVSRPRPSRTPRARATSSPSRSRRASASRSAPATIGDQLCAESTPGSCSDLVAVKPGGAYSQEAIEKSVEKMTLALATRAGLAFAQVRPTPKRDNAGRTIAIAFHVEEGPRIYVERIDIVGNKKTKDFVIRREFRVAEGDAVNAFMIERGRKRVQALGFFKSVPLKKRRARRRTRWSSPSTVVEQETDDLGFGVGYSTPRAWSATSRSPSAMCSATARRPASSSRQPDAAAGRGRLHRAALPRHQRRRRLRPLLQGRRLHHSGLLHEPEDRR